MPFQSTEYNNINKQPAVLWPGCLSLHFRTRISFSAEIVLTGFRVLQC